ncbi:hypothetical protein PV729_26780 [Streptomyces europaeiscabiei]|uniref:Uncharacterized protein n=1 Tax=Streptomyces europaeiscabiei TaxID=146819 RepID=A0ABU4NT32_9ACTN|nr:hypothetical protein [Streptomyces europaeiscabiei]MDX3555328.1 hypothetical protein [Streptomyces europaeiscabiei]MDX3705342.1 hypothetical protein [Streptomyces europaeiscabiei]
MHSEEITRALTAVLQPAPGNTLSLRPIHRAVVRQMGHSDGASFGALKAILRACGVVVTRSGTHSFAHGVSLTSDQSRTMRGEN